jgi:hypothetical protein
LSSSQMSRSSSTTRILVLSFIFVNPSCPQYVKVLPRYDVAQSLMAVVLSMPQSIKTSLVNNRSAIPKLEADMACEGLCATGREDSVWCGAGPIACQSGM